jgi:tetratricopeptide (TPR) repeat protein
MKLLLSLAAASFVAGGLSIAPPAFANDSGGNSNSTPECPKGQVYSTNKKMCVNAQSGLVDDHDLLAYASMLSHTGRPDEALAMLDLLKDPNTAEALNYRGYATRAAGRLDEGIGYYLKSVSLDPKYALVREYLGEAYVLKGEISLAKEQLSAIEKLCGTTCESYQDLAEAIQAKAT